MWTPLGKLGRRGWGKPLSAAEYSTGFSPAGGPYGAFGALSCSPLAFWRPTYPHPRAGALPGLRRGRLPVYSIPSRTRRNHETNFPAQQTQAQEDPWLPHPHEDARRPRDHRAQAGQGAGPALSLNPRLPSRRVREVLASGRPSHGDHVVAFVASGSGGVAFVAGRKVGKAVQRNRSRRLLRAAWSQIADRAEEGTDVVLVARRNILEIGSAEVAGEISTLLFGGAR